MQRMLERQELDLFVRVVDVRSFTEAARQIGVPTSTVSRTVSRLETVLATRLFERRPRTLILTEAGQRLYDQAFPHIAALRSVLVNVRRAQAEAEGLLRVTCPPDSRGFLGELFVRFLQRYPRITLDIDSSTRFVDLVKEGYDVALRATRALRSDSGLAAKKMVDETLGFFASPQYLARRTSPRLLSDLTSHDFILTGARDDTHRLTVRGPRGAEKVTVRGRIHANEIRLVQSLLCAGAGIGMLPTRQAQEDVPSGRLVRVLPDFGAHAGSFYVVYRHEQHLPRKVAAFRDFVIEYFRTVPW